jgi:hypothetical protein
MINMICVIAGHRNDGDIIGDIIDHQNHKKSQKSQKSQESQFDLCDCRTLQ